MTLITKIKELFTAHYSPESGRIEGCTYGGYAWYHEARHKEQFENKAVYRVINTYHIIFYSLAIYIFYLGLTNRNAWKAAIYCIGLLALPYITMLLLLEVDAWIVGTWRYLRK